jgi:hypothetical protein
MAGDISVLSDMTEDISLIISIVNDMGHETPVSKTFCEVRSDEQTSQNIIDQYNIHNQGFFQPLL